MMRALAWAVVASVFAAASAQARPVEDGTRISILAGARYVPHRHFEQEALSTGTPVSSDPPIGPEVLASFAYAPMTSIEISLELGWAMDHYQLQNSTLVMENVPLVATLRWFPFDTKFCPYLGAGGGYMLGFVSGAPSGETETHAEEFHAMVGATYPLSEKLWLVIEDRFQLASGDIVPIGQIQTGGNALTVGLSFVLEPAKDIAPH
jgi:outer membrane protein W